MRRADIARALYLSMLKEAFMADTCTACDSCGKPLKLGRATCVTNATEHKHADTPECVAALEESLGTAA